MTQTLPTAVLGRTGIAVTRLGFGTSVEGAIDVDRWETILNAILDQGINFIDTANDYGIGWGLPAEELIGRYIATRRDEFYLATKCGSSPTGHIWTRDNLFRGLYESLSRLRMDYIDVMLLHSPTVDECQRDDLVRALEDMREQGKVRWIGVSTNLPDLPTFLEWGVFDVLQIPYSALERDHEEWISRAAQAGIGIVIRGGTAQGEPGVGHGNPDHWQPYHQAALDEIRPPTDSRTTFILRHTMSHPHAHTIIVGTMNPEHLHENVQAALRGPLPDSVYTEFNRRLDAL